VLELVCTVEVIVVWCKVVLAGLVMLGYWCMGVEMWGELSWKDEKGGEKVAVVVVTTTPPAA